MAMGGLGDIGAVIGQIARGIISGVGEGIGEGIGKGVAGLMTGASEKFDEYEANKEDRENPEDSCELSDECKGGEGHDHQMGAVGGALGGNTNINIINGVGGAAGAGLNPGNPGGWFGGGGGGQLGSSAGAGLPDMGWLQQGR